MEKANALAAVEGYVFSLFEAEPTGHDFYHMKRVAKMAAKLAAEEGADPFIAEAAGWLHDIGDSKLFDDPKMAKQDLKRFLAGQPLKRVQIDGIFLAMENVSFQSGHRIPATMEGKVVQDADRLDALGAIGIARTFAFGGAKGQLMHAEDEGLTSVRHFYDKLFKLKDLMNTKSAADIAKARHRLMEDFLDHFFLEWDAASAICAKIERDT